MSEQNYRRPGSTDPITCPFQGTNTMYSRDAVSGRHSLSFDRPPCVSSCGLWDEESHCCALVGIFHVLQKARFR